MSSDDMINSDLAKGYRDGIDPHSPEPSMTGTPSYCHGFRRGRDDLRRKQAPAFAPVARPRWREGSPVRQN